MPKVAYENRRKSPRHEADALQVTIRRKGRLGRLTGMAIDYNRHGLAVLLDQPLSKDATVYLSLSTAQAKVDNVIGVVHNCIGQELGYRCGIQFRTASPLQSDRNAIEEQLTLLEAQAV